MKSFFECSKKYFFENFTYRDLSNRGDGVFEAMGVPFHAGVMFGLGPDFLFKSILARCAYLGA